MNVRLAPPGLHDARIIDCIDLGEVTTPWGDQHKIELRFRFLAAGEFFYVERRYTFNLRPKTHLSRDLESLLGHLPGPDYNLRNLIDLECQLHLANRELPGGRLVNRILGLLPTRNAQKDEFKPPCRQSLPSEKCCLPEQMRTEKGRRRRIRYYA